MIKKQFYAFLIISILIACNKKKDSTEESIISTEEIIHETTSDVPEQSLSNETTNRHPDYPKRIDLDFNTHKDILDIILLLPDEVFTSWAWSKNDRQSWYDEIKKNDYYLDNDPIFLNQMYLTPHTAGFSIIDGYWTISIYKTNDNSFIVVTDDIVSDGNGIFIIEVKDNEILNSFTQEEVFGNFEELVTLPNLSTDCIKKIENSELSIYDVELKDKSLVTFESSWYHTESEYKNCLKGNTVQYIFNPDTKAFDVQKIYWKPKRNY
ncbi:hypothetical protein [Myroides marinus]|uniref:hypothetical protein n=1 Tax=Myroides marinus TaxID=703342 RepID=UPI0025785E07|nr:hypothetical protein [Myroides marinus]MDM1378452.1 hypothetical protein [Myroides marinus]MDM1385723.1 hypothetical protein [Myroides marinus]MDM1392936.1 hypothetical protein [Myroides marinus]